MKAFIGLLFIFISLQAFASHVCDYNETSETEFEVTKVSKNPNRFTFKERHLIHRVITMQNFAEGVGRDEAVKMFEEGEILYFGDLILVHYYPGDTEVGAYFQGNQLIATVGDSYIYCVR